MFFIHYGQIVSRHAPRSDGMASSPCTVPHSPHIRWRGGATTDPGTATYDASVDLEVFLSEDEADVMAIARRHLVPKVCEDYLGRLDDGQQATAAETCGDGACSLHSLWGSVISSPFGNMYYCEDARRKLCEAMPIDVNDILTSPCDAAARVLIDNLWSDVIGYIMRKTRQEAVVPGNCLFRMG